MASSTIHGDAALWKAVEDLTGSDEHIENIKNTPFLVATSSVEERFGTLEIFKRPLCLVSIDDKGNFKIEDKALRQISRIDVPISVVGVCGDYRTGKSNLMNHLAQERTGFPIGHLVYTKGIWAWCKPNPTVSDQVLVLLDTEGFADAAKSDEEHDLKLFCLTMLMSSTLIYNMNGVIDQDALKKLSFVTDITKQVSYAGVKYSNGEDDKSGIQINSPHFVLCLQDDYYDLIDDGEMTADEYMESCLAESSDKPTEEFNNIRSSIRNFFPNRTCMVLPLPSIDIPLKCIDTLDDESVDPSFWEDVKKLQTFVYNSGPKCLNAVTKHSWDGNTFDNFLRTYIQDFSNGRKLEYGTAMERYHNEKLEDKVCLKNGELLDTLKLPQQSELNLVASAINNPDYTSEFRLDAYQKEVPLYEHKAKRCEALHQLSDNIKSEVCGKKYDVKMEESITKHDDDAWTIDENKVSVLLSEGKLPNAKQLKLMCETFGPSSRVVREGCAYICSTLQTTSRHIKRCWPAYFYDKNEKNDTNLVTFVAVKDIEEELNIDQIFGYNKYELFDGSHSDETSEMMKHDVENADSSDDNIDKVNECVSKHAPSLMCSHSNITLIAGSTVKSIGYISEKKKILTKPCVAIYVHKKGYIPLGEEPFPTKLDGFETDVRECVLSLFGKNDKAYEKHDKLLMGTSIRNRRVGTSIGNRRLGTSIGIRRVGTSIGIRRVGTSIGIRRVGTSIGIRRVGTSIVNRRVGTSIGTIRVGTSIGNRRVGTSIGSRRVGTSIGNRRVGISIGSRRVGPSMGDFSGSGTLGGFVEHPKYGLCGLTCAHVLCADHLNSIDVVKQWPDWTPGIDVIQPASSVGTKIGEVVWALLRKDGQPFGIDVALFNIQDRLPKFGQFAIDTPAVFCANEYNSGNIIPLDRIEVGKECIKYGSETGRTKATLMRKNSVLITDRYTLQGQMMVDNSNGFADHGDSGALAFNEGNNGLKAIGLVVGGNNLPVCFLTPLSAILDALNEGYADQVTMKQFNVADNEPMEYE